jgi:hypothetical protein
LRSARNFSALALAALISVWVGAVAGGVALASAPMTLTWRVSWRVASLAIWASTSASLIRMPFLSAYCETNRSPWSWDNASSYRSVSCCQHLGRDEVPG